MTAELPEDVQELVTKLFNFARTGDLQLLQYVDQGVAVDLTNHEGNTLLMIAAYAGSAELVAGLLQRGADPDHRNDRNQTPLAGAIFKNEDEVVEALLAAGANPDLGTPSARDTASMFGRSDLLERF